MTIWIIHIIKNPSEWNFYLVQQAVFKFPWNHGSAVRALVGRVYLVCSGRRRNSIKALQKKEIEAGNWSFRLPPTPPQHSSTVGSISLLNSILISTNSIGFALETFYTFCLWWIEYVSREISNDISSILEFKCASRIVLTSFCI